MICSCIGPTVSLTQGDDVMQRTRSPFTAVLAAALLCGGGTIFADGPSKVSKEVASFGILRTVTPETAKSQALDWFKGAGKNDAAAQKDFDNEWASDRPLLDKVANTLRLGDADAKKLLDDAGDVYTAAPQEVPA